MGNGVAASPRTDSGSRGIAAAKTKKNKDGGAGLRVKRLVVYYICNDPQVRYHAKGVRVGLDNQ